MSPKPQVFHRALSYSYQILCQEWDILIGSTRKC